MIVTEYYKTRADGVVLNRTYSDEGKYIIQNETGIIYDEAIDVEGTPYTYSESDIMRENASSVIEEKAAAYDVLMGVAE